MLALALTIALAVGSDSAIYSFIQGPALGPSATLLHGRLVSVFHENALHQPGPFFQSEYEQLSNRAGIFDWLGAARIAPSEAFIRDNTAVLSVAMITPNLAGALNLHPRHGVTISERLWRSEYGAVTLPTGARIRIDNVAYPITGIAPSELEGLYRDRPVDVWVPWQNRPLEGLERQQRNLWLVARTHENVPISQAQAILRKNMGNSAAIVLDSFRDMTPGMAKALSQMRALVALAATAVFLIACINIAALLTARASRRSHEISLRVALGASRGELAQETLSDSAVIAFAGGAIGLLLAVWTAQLVPAFLFKEDAERFAFAPHLATIAMGALACILTVVLFGMLPLATIAMDRPWAVLRSESGTPSIAQKALWAGIALGQIALFCLTFLSIVLLLQRLRPTGAEERRGNPVLLTVQALAWPAVDPEYFKRVERQVSSLDGVVPLAWASPLPGNQPGWQSFRLEPHTKDFRNVTLRMDWLTPKALDTLETPPLAGRLFSFQDQISRAGVLDEAAAAQLFGRDSVGMVIEDPTATPVEIIGVVRKKPAAKSQAPTIYFESAGSSKVQGRNGYERFRVPVAPPRSPVPLGVNIVSANYFDTYRMPLLAGSLFPATQPSDQHRIGLINQEAAGLFFGERPIGTYIIDDQGMRTEIIGVVGSRQVGILQRPAAPAVYFPMWQDIVPRMTLIMMASHRDKHFMAQLQQRVDAVPGRDPAGLVLQSLDEQLTYSALPPLRIVQLIAGALACVATLLTVLGLFSSQSYAGFQRRQELGLRIALGAPRRYIFFRVVAGGLWLTLVGSLIGLFLAFGLLHAVEGDTTDNGMQSLSLWLAGPLLAGGLVLLTNAIPAYRSSRLNPVNVMRGEHPNLP